MHGVLVSSRGPSRRTWGGPVDLEDLEVDLEEDLEQFSNYYSNYYKLVAAQGIKTAPSRLEIGFLKALFHNKSSRSETKL